MGVAVRVGGTGVFVGVGMGAGPAVSRVAEFRLRRSSKSASSGVAVLVGGNGSMNCIRVIAVAEGEAVGVAVGLATVSMVGPLSGAMLHGLAVVAVICWPAAMTTSWLSVVTWAVPASVSMWVCVSESTSTVSLVYLAEATAAGVRISKRSAAARGVLTS